MENKKEKNIWQADSISWTFKIIKSSIREILSVQSKWLFIDTVKADQKKLK